MIDMLFDTKDSPSKTLYSGVFEGESLADGKDTSAVGAACFPLRPRDVVFGSEREAYWRCVESHVWKTSVYSHTSSRESRCPDCYVETKDWLANSPLVQIWHPTKNLPRVPEDVTVRSNKIFWWQHGEFVWQVSAKDRQKKDGPVLQLS